MAKARTKTAGTFSPGPWWLMEGDEECLGCGQLYIYELQFHCPECESATCIHCRRRHSDGRMVCTSCAEAAGKGATHGS